MHTPQEICPKEGQEAPLHTPLWWWPGCWWPSCQNARAVLFPILCFHEMKSDHQALQKSLVFNLTYHPESLYFYIFYLFSLSALSLQEVGCWRHLQGIVSVIKPFFAFFFPVHFLRVKIEFYRALRASNIPISISPETYHILTSKGNLLILIPKKEQWHLHFNPFHGQIPGNMVKIQCPFNTHRLQYTRLPLTCHWASWNIPFC